MPNLGVSVLTAETPPSSINTASTSTAFFVGIADWGASGSTGVGSTLVTNLTQAAAVIGGPTGQGTQAARTTTNATLFDSLDAYFREGGSAAYISRVLGASGNASATLALAPSAAITLTAQYSGVGGNNIYVAVTNNTTNVVITLQDSAGNVLATSPQLATLPAIVSWAATTGLVTAASSGATLPSTVAATQMTGGSNGTTPTLTQWTTAITAFGPSLGPGQILAPGETNTALAGIWSALLTHASANNRWAILDETDGASTSTVSSDLATAALSSALQQYGELWAGNRLIAALTGVAGASSRSVPPSPVIAGLKARVDATGNPNQASAGRNFSLNYATAAATQVSAPVDTYSFADLQTLKGLGVNGFYTEGGIAQAYGNVSLVPSTTDAIYWQASHGRFRMALVFALQQAAAPFVFSQVDGQGSDIAEFNSAIQNALMQFYNAGALYGAHATDAFTVNTGSGVNAAALLAAGQLTGSVAVRMSPTADFVLIQLNAVPITQTLTQTASPAQNQ